MLEYGESRREAINLMDVNAERKWNGNHLLSRSCVT